MYGTQKSLNKIREVNDQYRSKAKEQVTSKNIKLRSLQTNAGIGAFRRKNVVSGSPEKRQSMLIAFNDTRPNATPFYTNSPLQKKMTVRINTTKKQPRKSEILRFGTSLMSTNDSSKLRSPMGEFSSFKKHALAPPQESKQELSTIKEKLRTQNTIKPEVTISEYDITK